MSIAIAFPRSLLPIALLPRLMARAEVSTNGDGETLPGPDAFIAGAWYGFLRPLIDKPKPQTLSVARCPGGGIGRRAGFRYQWCKPWRFESSPGHQHGIRCWAHRSPAGSCGWSSAAPWRLPVSVTSPACGRGQTAEQSE